MNYFSSNLKSLRTDQNISQKLLGDKLHMSRENISRYESGKHEPSIDVLINISRYFKVSLDVLLTVHLRNGADISAPKDERSVLFPIQVDREGRDVIEVVSHNAQAGYAGQYADPGYIESLESIQLPMLGKLGKCRCFPIDGDSMPPYTSGSYIIAEYVEGMHELQDNTRYILITRDDGIVFKRIFRKEKGIIELHSDNPQYAPYTLESHDILEVWKAISSIDTVDATQNSFVVDMHQEISELQEKLGTIAKKIGL